MVVTVGCTPPTSTLPAGGEQISGKVHFLAEFYSEGRVFVYIPQSEGEGAASRWILLIEKLLGTLVTSQCHVNTWSSFLPLITWNWLLLLIMIKYQFWPSQLGMGGQWWENIKSDILLGYYKTTCTGQRELVGCDRLAGLVSIPCLGYETHFLS